VGLVKRRENVTGYITKGNNLAQDINCSVVIHKNVGLFKEIEKVRNFS